VEGGWGKTTQNPNSHTYLAQLLRGVVCVEVAQGSDVGGVRDPRERASAEVSGGSHGP
jgi:hypothetical protein